VSFTKGCYPGQEIVARVQHLGILKERAHAFHVDAPPPEPNTRIFLAGTDQTPGSSSTRSPFRRRAAT
jgi:folate-binding Fe-S cluster repair protein YgfZ